MSGLGTGAPLAGPQKSAGDANSAKYAPAFSRVV